MLVAMQKQVLKSENEKFVVKTKLRGGGPRSLITPHLFRLDECCWQSPDQPEFRAAWDFLAPRGILRRSKESVVGGVLIATSRSVSGFERWSCDNVR